MNRLALVSRCMAALAALVAGCAQPETRYGDAKGVETVTNQFGSTDLQMIAESMARSMQQAPVIVSNNLPVVTVQEVRNKTSEYIDTRAITDSIRAELQKGGQVRFAVDAAGHEAADRTRSSASRATYYAREQPAEMGRMVGAPVPHGGQHHLHREAGEGHEGRVLQAQPAALEHPQRAARVVGREGNPQDHHPRIGKP